MPRSELQIGWFYIPFLLRVHIKSTNLERLSAEFLFKILDSLSIKSNIVRTKHFHDNYKAVLS